MENFKTLRQMIIVKTIINEPLIKLTTDYKIVVTRIDNTILSIVLN